MKSASTSGTLGERQAQPIPFSGGFLVRFAKSLTCAVVFALVGEVSLNAADQLQDLILSAEPSKLDQFLKATPGALQSKDAKGYTPLHIAVLNAKTNATEFLLRRGADPNIADNSG